MNEQQESKTEQKQEPRVSVLCGWLIDWDANVSYKAIANPDVILKSSLGGNLSVIKKKLVPDRILSVLPPFLFQQEAEELPFVDYILGERMFIK
jgi:hypothetical protein